MKKSKVISLVWQIAKVNLRHNFLPLCGLSFLIILLIPIIFGVTDLDRQAAAVPLEMLLSIIGIVIIVPIFQPEQNPDIEDVIASKSIDLTYVHLIRAAYSVLSVILLVALFSGFLLFNGCEITPGIVFGTIADALFLGGIGLLTAAITSSLTVSFMPPIIYYLANFMLQGKMGGLNLFSMMRGDYVPNIWLFSVGFILIAMSVLVRRMILKGR